MLEAYDLLGFKKEFHSSAPGETCGNISDYNFVNSTQLLNSRWVLDQAAADVMLFRPNA